MKEVLAGLLDGGANPRVTREMLCGTAALLAASGQVHEAADFRG